jgi:hypothetical protein
MKHSINKLYEGLTNQERAAIAFHYALSHNLAELQRVADATPKKCYQCTDMEFQGMTERYFMFASAWAIEHWQKCAQMFLAFASANVAARSGDLDQTVTEHGNVKKFEAQLIALDRVLQEVCDNNGLSPDDVHGFANSVPFTPAWSKEPDEVYQNVMRGKFSLLIGE